VGDFKEEGFLPDAMLNFLALLGWNDGSEQEIFSRAELVDKFALDRITKSGAVFDKTKLSWMNGANPDSTISTTSACCATQRATEHEGCWLGISTPVEA